MPRTSNIVPPEVFESLRQRAEDADAARLAQADDQPYLPPDLPDWDDMVEGAGGVPKAQWPEDVILAPDQTEPPANTVPAEPVPAPLPGFVPRPDQPVEDEVEVIETSDASVVEADGVVADADGASLVQGARTLLERQDLDTPADVEAANHSIGGLFRDMASRISDVAHHAQAAILEADDGVVETSEADVVEADVVEEDTADDDDYSSVEP